MKHREYMLQAQMRKNDEFYTQYSDIESELKYYLTHFAGKVIYCNCDDPRKSEFTRYFTDNFAEIGLKKLISTYYSPTSLFESKPALIQIKDSRGIHTGTLRGDGDFRSPECIDLLQQADIVVTNPPFSLFREYISLLIKYEKQYLVMGHQNASATKCLAPSIIAGEAWLGPSITSGGTLFSTPGCGEKEIPGIRWYTNMEHGQSLPPIELTERYSTERYPAYDNYDAINVSKISDIPLDYDGVMGVSINYLTRHCPEQFALLGFTNGRSPRRTKIYPPQTQVDNIANKRHKVNKLNDTPALRISDPSDLDTYYIVDGQYYRSLFTRLLIQRKKA